MEAVGDNPRSSSEAVAHKTRRGFNLIEAAFVLAVVGGVIGTIWVSAATVYENYKVNETVKYYLLISKNIQSLISEQNGSTLGNIYTFSYELFNIPESWVNETKVYNPFGGVLKILNMDAGTPYFSIASYYQKIPTSACIKLVSRIGALGTANSLFRIMGYDEGWTNQRYLTSFPVGVDTAKIFCASGVYFLGFHFNYTRIN